MRVYETEPNAVWYGYTMGYLYNFLAWGTYVYGTGWAYPPYWYNWAGYGYPIYYPRPVTWGLGAYYNPVRGMYGRYGYAYGPYRGIAGARAWNPVTGTYGRAGAAWGPRGSAGFVGAYNPRTDGGAFAAGGRNVYGAWKSAGVKRGSEWARLTARENVAGGSSLRWNTSNGQGFIREGRRGDLYAGRDGNVYRNTGDGWQRFDGGWQDVGRPQPQDLLQRGEGRDGLSSEGRERLQERGGGEALRGLAGAGAAGAAGAALGQRLGGGDPVRRDAVDRDTVRDRAQQRQTPQQRPATQQRQGPQQREAARERAQQRQAPQQREAGQQRRAAQDRPAAQRRPASQQRQATRQRPATRQPLPSNVMRDVQARHVGNQRQMASRQFSRPPAQFSRSGSFGPSRSMGPRGGFGGGGGRGGGFGGGRGGGRR